MRQVHATRTCGVVNVSGAGWALWGLAALVPLALATPPAPFTDPNSGIEMVRIGAVDNPAWAGNGTPGDRAVGRGSVGYEYSIGQLEVTSGQWVEFFNAAYDRPANDRLPHLLPPTFWGGIETTPTVPGGRRWTTTSQSAMLPTGDISWRMAAMYCNWLHNDKATNREAFLNGAYDVSTFGFTPGGRFTDQLTHNEGARYWIPTWDEWLKAAHFDPDKPNGDGTIGGWWQYSTTSDTAPAYGPPGMNVRAGGVGVVPAPDPNGPLAQANAGWDGLNFTGNSPFTIPLGAYADVTSPWGLLDTAGGTSEWVEEANLLLTARGASGSAWALSSAPLMDLLYIIGNGGFPSLTTYDLGFRIASSIPAPGFSSLGVGIMLLMLRRGSRRVR